MEIKMSKEDIIKLVSEKLNLPNPLSTLSWKMGKRNPFIRVSGGLLKYVFKGSSLYGLVPEASTKHGTNDWTHDMSSFIIYKIDKDFLENYVKEHELEEDSPYEFNVQDLLQVYSSNEGVKADAMNDDVKTLSTRDLVCVLLKLPEASEAWINKLIDKANNNK